MDCVKRKAYAKINLGLDVLRRRPDGYHEVRMVMQTVDITDLLTFRRTDRPGILLRTDKEELPSGKGIADVVYLPKRNSMLPALVVELKWNKTSEGAIRQITEKNYPAVLEGYGGEVVMAGINYDAERKVHSCLIERIRKP